MRKHIIHLSFALALLTALACNPKSSDNNTEKNAQPLQEIKEDRVELVVKYPKEGFKNSNYLIKHYPGLYKFEGMEIPEELIHNILTAANNKLIPSNALYACRFAENAPQIKITIPNKDGIKYIITTASNCFNRAPWNIQKNDELFTQISGELFEPVEKLLNKLNSEKWKQLQKPESLMTFTPYDTPEHFKERPNFNQPFIDALTNSQQLKDFTASTPQISSLELACQQSESKDCSTISALASLKVNDSIDFIFPLNFIEQKPSITELPPSFDIAKKIADSNLAKTMKKYSPNTLKLVYEASSDCDAVISAAPTYLPKENTENITNCSAWLLYAESNPNQKSYPPRIIYYPTLDAAWITFAPELIDPDFFKALDPNADPNKFINETTVFSTLDGKMTIIK